MATTIKQSFNEYASNLNISNKQESLVSTRRENVVNAIDKELFLLDEKSKLIGSYDRNTLIRYLFEGDIDVMVIMNYGKHKDWDCADGTINALNKFRALLDDAYPDTTKYRDENCITMKFSEFKLDVVPAFFYNSGRYSIPDSVKKRWITTDPFSFAEKITEVNTSMGGTFVPLIKMVKGWNREVGNPIRSYHLENIMYNRYQGYKQGYSYDSMLRYFFEYLPSYLSYSCYDPITSEQVDSYLDNGVIPTKRQIAISKAQKAAEKSKEAYEDEEKYPITSIAEWKDLLGEFFPAYE